MQRTGKKKTIPLQRRLLKVTDENAIPRRASNVKKPHGIALRQSNKASNMTADITYICKSIEQRNKDSQLMIGKLLENSGRKLSSKTVRKLAKSKPAWLSANGFNFSREILNWQEKTVDFELMNRTDTKTLHKSHKSVSKLVNHQRNLVRQMNANVHYIFH